MLTTVVGAIGALILLSLMLLVHELGHFVAAKRSGVVVEEFGFGYPPRLITLFRHGGTDYTLNAIPFGGFTRMKGEDDEAGPGSFVKAAKWKRSVILLAGAGMNLVLAVVLLTAAFLVGYPVLEQGARVTRVVEDSAAWRAGLQANDVILQLDDQVLMEWTDLASWVRERPDQRVELAVKRGDERLLVTAALASENGEGRLGIELKPAVRLQRYAAHQALLRAVQAAAQFVWLTITLPVALIRGGISLEAARPVGPVGLYQLASSATEYVLASGRWFAVLELGGMLNAAVAITNLLPLPGLDGGRLLFIIAEAIRGKRVAPEREGTIHFIGMLVLVLVAVFITVQDIVLGVAVPDWSQLGL